jgi:predicted GNAT family N-acyltransferase
MPDTNANTEKLNKIVEFLTTELRPSCNWSIQDEYPQVFEEHNIHNLKYIEKDGQPVTHAALKPIILKTPQILYKIGAIGSVVTNPHYRGQGLSSRVIRQCLDEAKNQDCDIAILWTNLHDFYRRLGFELAGFEEYFQIEAPLPNASEGLKFLNSTQVDPNAIVKLFNRHTITSVRSADDIKKYLTIPNTQLYTAWDTENNIKAYAVIGKGADLEGFAHEWGGNISDLFALLNYILHDRKKSFTLLTGAQSINLITQLQRSKIVGQQGFLGMVKVLNWEKFSKKIEKLSIQVGIRQFSINPIENGKFFVSINTNEILLNDEAQMVQFLFGPSPKIQAKAEVQQTILKLFPLPLWIWGWDSI